MYGRDSRGLLAPRLDFMSISLLCLGIGSFLFHASLRATFEFADEFSMLGLTWSMLQSTLTVRQPHWKAHSISVCLAICFTSFSALYLQSPDIIYQVIAFATGLFVVILRSQYLFHWLQPAYPKAKSRDWNVRTWKAIALCLVGYALWNIDLQYCAELRQIRHRVGLPCAWLFELHGWWHVLTAIGASQFMDVAREVRQHSKQEQMNE
ncbi:hypothetical protein CDD83_1344 [Cordyceps sp. RAO-2017]|nr:hypothetical protein CDD83_1344 [Cordyceps sp. RAO-2017]